MGIRSIKDDEGYKDELEDNFSVSNSQLDYIQP